MKTFIAILFGISLCAHANGQTTGKVVDKETNEPIADAWVELPNNQRAKTNKKGEFSFACEENMKLNVQLDGFKNQTYTVKNCNDVTIRITNLVQEFGVIEITDYAISDDSLLIQPMSIAEIGNKEIQRGNGLFMLDAINTNVPGVIMQSRTTTGGQQFNIRGYGNGTRGTRGISSNFDGQGTKVYLNGIPVTNAEGISVMDDIDFASISNVEILKGPSGTIYGNAIAGAVQLQTRKAAANETSIGQTTTFGSYGLLRTTTQVALGTSKSSFLMNYGHQQFDGFMPHTATKKNFVNMIGDFNVSKKQSVSTYLGVSEGYDERNGELTIEQYDTLDYSGNQDYIDNNAHSGARTIRAGVGHTYAFTNRISNTTSIFGVSQQIDNSSAGGWNDVNNTSFGVRSVFDMSFKLSDKISLKGKTGVECQKTSTLANSYKMSADSTDLDGYNVITSLRSVGFTQSESFNAFSQWILSLPADFDVTAGIGYNQMDLSYEDRLWGLTNNAPGNTTPKSYAATYADMLSPTVGINKRIKSNVSVYGSFSIGYKAPVSSYFYIPQTGEVNLGLEPEKGTQFEIGTKGNLMKNRLFYTLAVYSTTFTNKMTTVTVQNPQNTATLYAYVRNGGTVNNNGVEFLVKFDAIQDNGNFIKALQPFANFTYAHYRYGDYTFETVGDDINGNDSTIVHDFTGNTVVGTPPMSLNLGVDVDTKIGLYGNVVFNYRDAVYYTSDGLNQADPYALLNAKLGYKKTIGQLSLDAYFGANNITGSQYYYMVFVNQLPDAYIPAPREINFFGGVNLKYNF